MNEITFLIPIYNPDLNDLKKSVDKVLEVKNAQIILIDDKSTDQTHFEYLRELEKIENVSIYLNDENRGPFWNGIFAYTLPTTTWVKKVDPDDEINPDAYNNIELDESASIYLTGYKYKKYSMNRKLGKDIGHIFNGSCIYKSSSAKEAANKILKDKPEFKKWFEDQLIPYMILLNNEKLITNTSIFYIYKELATSTPKFFKKNYEDWMHDYSTMFKYINDNFNENNLKDSKVKKLFKRNYGKQMIFANLIALDAKDGDKFFENLYPSAYKKCPKWFRIIIAKITMKF